MGTVSRNHITLWVDNIQSRRSYYCPHNGWPNGYSFQGEEAANDCADDSRVDLGFGRKWLTELQNSMAKVQRLRPFILILFV